MYQTGASASASASTCLRRAMFLVAVATIALALLGRASPAGVVAASFLFAVFRTGATGMQSVTETPVDIVLVIQSLIILFVAAQQLFVRGIALSGLKG